MELHVNEFRGSEIIAAYTTPHLDMGLTPIGRSGNAVLFRAKCGADVVVSAPRSEGSVIDKLQQQGYEVVALPEMDLSRYFS